jgi:serine/threonine protein kinase
VSIGYDGLVTAPVEFGSYLVYEQLGVGGMASVYVAESRGLRKRVALKRLLPHAAENPEVVQSFIHEARLVGQLRHPNIAQTYDFGQVGDTYFIAMELVPGPTIAQLIRQCKATVGIIPFPITLNILCQVCDALEYAHKLTDERGKSLGLIHRDVSPPNIIVSATGIVKLIDFGVAKMARSSNQTMVGTVKGKFSYMAPEYLAGQLDARVDVWALGAVAYELLTNVALFDAKDDLGVLERVKHAPIPAPSRKNSDVPRDLDACVLTALEREPARRWQSALAMRNALANVTSEIKTSVTNAQMMEWIEWAFEQKQKPSNDASGVSQLIALLEKPSEPGRKPPKGAPAKGAPAGVASAKKGAANAEKTERVRGTDVTMPATPGAKSSKPPSAKPSGSAKPRPSAKPAAQRARVLPVHPGSSHLLLWLLVVLVAAGVGAVIYFDLLAHIRRML